MRDVKRECRDHERPWRGYCVDSNLEDEWLERLNSLKVFHLINICEGHPQRAKSTSTRYAHIYLRLNETYLREMVKCWETIRPTLLKEVHRLFQDGKTHLNFALDFKLRTGRGRLVYQEGLSLKIRANKASSMNGMNESVRNWFESSIDCLEFLDQTVFEQLSKINAENYQH